MVTPEEAAQDVLDGELCPPDDRGVRHPRCVALTKRKHRCRRAALAGTPCCAAHSGGVRNTAEKGKAGVRKAVKMLQGVGVTARAQPRSGSIEGLPHDVVLQLKPAGQLIDYSAEVKQYARSCWRTLDKKRDGADLLVLYLDQQAPGVPAPEPMLFMPATTLRALVGDGYERGFGDAVHEVKEDLVR